MIFFYIWLAFVNGMIIALCRTMNGRLCVSLGPLKASLCNYIVGFILLSVFMFFKKGPVLPMLSHIPFYTFLSGFYGAFFVVVNSYIFFRIGALKTLILVISGQMIFSVLIEYKNETIQTIATQFIGIAMILFGIYILKNGFFLKVEKIGEIKK